MGKKLYLYLALCLLTFLLGIPTFAQSLIIENPPESSRWGASLPIQQWIIDTNITDQTAITRVEQVFHNPHSRAMEATYLFPVPKGAHLSKFTLEIDGEDVKAEMMDRKKAEQIYESIVRNLRDPGLLTYAGQDLIQAKIFPIEANKTKKIQLRFEEILPYDQGSSRYTYPLNINTLCKKPIEFLKITAQIQSERPLRNIYSPSHDIQTDRRGETKASVKFSAENILPDQDFTLLFSVSPDPIGLHLLTYKERDKDGFYLLLAAPAVKQEEEAQAKTVVFVLDTSGSMKGDNKIEQARKAMEYCIRSLNSQDQFALLTFSDEILHQTDGLIPASAENREKTLDKIKEINASGGTHIDGALQAALSMLKENTERAAYLLFLTDGCPTVGEREPDAIIKHVKEWNQTKSRCFTFGVGYDVNTRLLDNLSQNNKGLSTYVKPKEDIEIAVSSLYSKIADPVLTDLQLDFGDVVVSKQYPTPLPDLFSGSQLVVLGRYKEGGSETLTLSGTANGKKQSFSQEFSFPSHDTSLSYIPRLWAARRIGYLMNEIRSQGKNQELVDEIVDLSKTYGILTEFTAFLVEEAPVMAEPVPEAVQVQREIHLRTKAADLMVPSLREEVGKRAIVNSEMMQNQLSDAKSLSVQNAYSWYDDQNRQQVQRIEGVRFSNRQALFNQDGRWISTQFNANQNVLKIKPYSRAYFQLAGLSTEIANTLALGPKVSFVQNTVMVQIDEDGVETLNDQQLAALR
ncbi:MAG: VIT and VWA domain-containing protein [bacterium]|jgi:Ca-activated chloride channel family protein|nr:VIT and VWA domain-containing protein [bacterium]